MSTEESKTSSRSPEQEEQKEQETGDAVQPRTIHPGLKRREIDAYEGLPQEQGDIPQGSGATLDMGNAGDPLAAQKIYSAQPGFTSSEVLEELGREDELPDRSEVLGDE